MLSQMLTVCFPKFVSTLLSVKSYHLRLLPSEPHLL